MFVLLVCLVMVLHCGVAPKPSQTPNTYLPRLPAGEYRIVYESVYPCDNNKSHPMVFNVYFSKKSRNVTEIKGNVVYEIPLDDRLNFEMNMASWGSTGGWVQNSYVYRGNQLCSETKKILGKSWIKMAEAFNVTHLDCPVAAGTYVTPGLNVRVLDGNTFPKVFFYGRYKFVLYIRNEDKDLVGCVALEIRIVRPWEMNHY